jgi:putative SOS response-associated peptidase YedK
MCALFEVKASSNKIKEKIPTFSSNDFEIDQLVLPYDYTKALVLENGSIVAKDMSFSLVPAWSKTKKVKFATHNARIETLLSKPTWKIPLETRRAVVSLTGFIEPIYEYEYAGNMVKFSHPQNDLILVAALYDQWVDKLSGEVLESFAIVTKAPGEFIKTIGHDRSPIFLDSKSIEEWLNPTNSKGESLINLLQSQKDIELAVSIHRPLKNSNQLSFFSFLSTTLENK